jgi:hypothetical protein
MRQEKNNSIERGILVSEQSKDSYNTYNNKPSYRETTTRATYLSHTMDVIFYYVGYPLFTVFGYLSTINQSLISRGLGCASSLFKAWMSKPFTR